MKAAKAKLNLFRAVEEILTVGGFPIEIKCNIDIIIGNPPFVYQESYCNALLIGCVFCTRLYMKSNYQNKK